MASNENRWVSTEPKIWKPTKEEETLQGVLTKKESRTDQRSGFYHIQDNNQQLHLVWGSAVLDRAMEPVKVDDEVRITYQGTKESKHGNPMKLFDVEKKSQNDQVRVTEEKVGGRND